MNNGLFQVVCNTGSRLSRFVFMGSGFAVDVRAPE